MSQSIEAQGAVKSLVAGTAASGAQGKYAASQRNFRSAPLERPFALDVTRARARQELRPESAAQCIAGAVRIRGGSSEASIH